MLRAAVAGALFFGSFARASDKAANTLADENVCKNIRATVRVTVTVTEDATAATWDALGNGAAAETIGFGKPGGDNSPNVNYGLGANGKPAISGSGLHGYYNDGWFPYPSSADDYAALSVKSKGHSDVHDGGYNGGYVPGATSKGSAAEPGYGYSADSYDHHSAAPTGQYGGDSYGSHGHDGAKPSNNGGEYGDGAYPIASSKSIYGGYGYGKHNTTKSGASAGPVDSVSSSSSPVGESHHGSPRPSSSAAPIGSASGSSPSLADSGKSSNSGTTSSASLHVSPIQGSSSSQSKGSSSPSASTASANTSSGSPSSSSSISSKGSSTSHLSSSKSSSASSSSSSVSSRQTSSHSSFSSEASSSTASSASSLRSSSSSVHVSSSSSSTITSLSSSRSSSTSSALTSSSPIPPDPPLPPVCILDGQSGCSASSPCCDGSTCGVDGVCRVCQAYNQVLFGGFPNGEFPDPWRSSSSGIAVTSVTPGESADGDGFAFVATIASGTVTLTQTDIAIRDGSTVFCSAFGATIPGLSSEFTINIDGVPCASATLSTTGEFEMFSGQLTVTGEEHIIEVVLAPESFPQVLYLDAVSVVPIAGDQYILECTPTGPVPQNCDYRGFSDIFCSYKGTRLGAACGAKIMAPVAFAQAYFSQNPNNYYRCLNLCAQEDSCSSFSFQRDSGGNTCFMFQDLAGGTPVYDTAYDVLSVRGYKLPGACEPDDLPSQVCTSPQCTIFGTDICPSCVEF